MTTEKSKTPNYEQKTLEIIAQMRQNHPNPAIEGLEFLAAACGSERFDYMTRLEREVFANNILEHTQFLQKVIE